jgi:hypothetical protein
MYRIYNNTVRDEYDNENRNDHTKKQCVDYIYETIDISRFKYEMLRFESELPQLLEKRYYVSANFSGNNCFLIFTKIKDKYHQFLIDRKTLSYNSEKVVLSQVRITPINVKLDINIYKEKGSIFDGIFITGKNNSKTFIITDVYAFKGQDMTNTPIDSKLLQVMTYFSSNYKPSDRENNLSIIINKLYPISSIDTLINNTIPKIKEFVVKGICLYPEKSSTKLVYMFDNATNTEDTRLPVKNFRENTRTKTDSPPQNEYNPRQQSQSINESQNIIPSVVKKIEKEVYIPKAGTKDTDYIFEMKKTEIVDVYNLNVVEPTTNEGKKVFKRVKIGLALVPGMERSVWCQELFEDGNNTSGCLVNCKFHIEKQKWQPIQIAEGAKRPSTSDEFTIVR